MMKKYILVLFASLSLIFISCNSNSSRLIANKADYKSYLTKSENPKLSKIKNEIHFWQQKFDNAPNQYSYLIMLASQYSQLFEIEGNIEDLCKAEKILLEVNQWCKEQNSGIQRELARNYITQHKFKDALIFLEKAYELGDNKIGTNKMLFDVYMELGNYKEAEEKLAEFTDFRDFDFVIRLAKWNDFKGNLPKTIQLMEKAKIIAEKSKKDNLRNWVYTNLADFYGHNNQYRESYEYYLKALELDNHNYYALKGIAWIIFSLERNPSKAMEIIDSLEKKYRIPDLQLFKSEIAEFQKNEKESRNSLLNYHRMLKDNNYGEMYNTYNFDLFVENPDMIEQAFKIAETEIKNRPTPASYDMLAWAYYKKGEYKKALEISQKHTINKSHEPIIVYHNAEILKANNMLQEKVKIKNELLSSIYELGPGFENRILNL